MFRSLAVATDFSDASRCAFPVASSLARKLSARLEVVHLATPALQSASRESGLQDRLEKLVAEEPSFHGLPVRAHVVRAGPADSAVALERREGIDLLVLATHGRTGASELFLGRFSSRLLHLSRAPILLVHTPPGGDSRLRKAFDLGRILLPHDFSRASGEALAVGRYLLDTIEGLEARLLHVVEDHRDEALSPAEAEDLAEVYEGVRAERLGELRDLVDRDFGSVSAEAAVRLGHPSVEIKREALEFGADLIVMASRGLSVLETIRIGSITERTIAHAPCPVLVVKGAPFAGKVGPPP